MGIFMILRWLYLKLTALPNHISCLKLRRVQCVRELQVGRGKYCQEMFPGWPCITAQYSQCCCKEAQTYTKK